MEKRRPAASEWVSILSLMRDGSELSEALKKVNAIAEEESRQKAIGDVIKPYLQFVEAGVRCEHTGLALSEIWRYFRHTWINEYKSLPGRSMSVLVRDAAAPNHPVIGIAALGSSVAQQSCRDRWIGWDGDTFIERLKAAPEKKYSQWIIDTVASLLEDVYIEDFKKAKLISYNDILEPTPEKIKRLRELALSFRLDHIHSPHTAKFVTDNDALTWPEWAQTSLYKSGRAQALADLLSIRLVLNKYNLTKPSSARLKECLEYPDFRDVVKRLVRKAESLHVGIDMMDIIVCGSIAPYNHLLGGKLTCMLLASPEVAGYYNKKYEHSISLIASSVGGKPVVRKPQLVLLGTTSLYGAGSSQYNRIKFPAESVGGTRGHSIAYEELGSSEGFGSFHFSATTLKLADAVAGRISGGARVNSIFGEGANPLMRRLRDALEHVGLDSTGILNHRNRRIIYGVALAENFGDVLIGLDAKAKYKIKASKVEQKTQLIVDFWKARWLSNRIKNEEVLKGVAAHTLSFPITHGAKVNLPGERAGELDLF